MVNNTTTPDPGPAVAAAIELLVRRGYDATTVDELADAAGISRSTFFRKFGSKEDIVFADHDRILARVQDFLTHRGGDPLDAVVDAALLVFDHHLRNQATALLRHELLRQVPALRDRELVMTHRYERAFRKHLQLPGAVPGGAAAVAFAAGVVAVHNSALRGWLRAEAHKPAEASSAGENAGENSTESTGTCLAAELATDLHELADRFRPVAGAPAGRRPAAPAAGRPAVVVTVLDRSAGTEEILQAVRSALE
ncbi:TetR/AcrR family transcriptional regulator [Pseudarthrobacter sp. P1]|uniref:TetR/AcrR family transcriptional regulator n=1 Tax=Pseudarthrobacter sp. P1 TaxID=3418418 RepID=UPI003CEB21FE